MCIRDRIEQGTIANAVIYSDAMDGEFIASLAPFLSGCRYDTAAMIDSLQQAVCLLYTSRCV